MIPYDRALALKIDPARQTYDARDTILYALGLGLGDAPTDPGQLAYLWEEKLTAFPTMPVALAFRSMRDIPLEIDYSRLVHGAQGLVIHKPLPVAGTVIGTTTVRDVIDRGADKGALIYLDRDLHDEATGDLLATVKMTAFCRGDGGVEGAPARDTPAVHPIPDRPADVTAEVPVLPQLALIYRLSGDLNPLHIDPALAAKVGFEAPILHGLATFGLAGRALVEHVLDWNAQGLREIAARFSAPVYPGETLKIEIWRDGGTASFRATSLQRDKVVLNNGYARLDGAG
ncbi:3-alpha,7-alpha,12-alpha-trihydroxy-5-beta-cholest-24-enoyl-CoA hydratase [Pseudooceanicola sp. 216_PA32_1]|uniref:3-alpha,7-alpha, 12-alpha-trihydroxy-5-beta-cholest-24-enoyl-CoA hydratase n=1 Tax=Pseudooceanicola pacificus TaxID=2676438 RepID=A0A844WBC6_9RHOB|nr:MaoC/PaaZ C-terminal domain-containing protein [Pseudooceanicola pacificus]MWB78098.1 3-alpha,7-alpha,12-alpha-trihydroxy-5-beta-cholest-24-enoyl-CoA hydratase [Pseudooceanicola pacificus]